MLQIERSGRVVASPRMCGSKLVGSGPRLKSGLALPHRMRGVERMVFGFGPLEQVELDETGNPVEVGLAAEPDLFEGLFAALLHPKSVHRDEHHIASRHKPNLRRRCPLRHSGTSVKV